MNKLIAGLSLGLVVILIVLILLMNLLKNKDTAISTIQISPTPFQNIDLSAQIQKDTIRNDSLLSPEIKSLTQSQSEQLDKIATLSGYTSSDLDIDYSRKVNTSYIHEKTPNAQDALRNLIGDELFKIYQNSKEYGNLFVKTTNPRGQREKDEEMLVQNYKQRKGTLSTTTPSKSKQAKEVQTLFKLFDIMSTFDLGSSSIPTTPTNTTGTAGIIQGSNSALDAIFNEAGQKTGTPPLILKGINAHECNLLSESDTDIVAWSKPGSGLPPSHKCYDAGPDGDGIDLGPMQLYVKYFQQELTAVNRLGGYTHTPNVENIRDAMYAAGDKLRKNSGGDWSCQKLKDVMYVWARGTERYVDPVQQEIFGWVWGYFTVGQPVTSTPC